MGIADRLQHNLSLKLLSLAIALLIWGAVHNQADPLVLRHRAVRIEVAGVPANLAVVSVEPAQVTVTLFGRASSFDQLEYEGFRLTATVSPAEVGAQTVAIAPEGLAAGLEIQDMSRKVVRVTLDALLSERRSITVETQGSPAGNLAVAKSEVEPGTVTVTGPGSQVQRVTRVLAQVEVTGRAETFTATVNLVAADAADRAVTGLRFEPAQATVVVRLQPVQGRSAPAPVPSARSVGEPARSPARPPQPPQSGPPAVSETPPSGVAPPLSPPSQPPAPAHREPADGSREPAAGRTPPAPVPTDAPHGAAHPHPIPAEPAKPAPPQ